MPIKVRKTKPLKDNMLPLGELLVAANFVTQRQVEKALQIQQESGGKLGEILISEGYIRLIDCYKALAEQQKLPFIDLIHNPPDRAVLEASDARSYGKYQAVPVQMEAGTIVIATTDITPELTKWVAERYEDYRFVITSPFDIMHTLRSTFDDYYTNAACLDLWRHAPHFSAREIRVQPSRHFMPVVALILTVLVIWSFTSLVSLLALINGLFLLTLLFKCLFFSVGLKQRRAIDHQAGEREFMTAKDLPVYTLLVPLYKEKQVTIRHLIRSMRMLDYPKANLDIKLIVEADDEKTQEYILAEKPERYFDIVSVPASEPRTKPKACNYALQFALGDYITIYDAEDRPDPLQLKKVIHAFEQAPDKVVCIQSKLNYYNYNENILTRMFALEYASWFNFLLIGLERLHMPIPLGGTSNHFKRRILGELRAWDPFNVTEDADLGLRLALKGYQTRIIDSTTLEEAPITLKNWINQRSRWIKGYMQTCLVHLRSTRKMMETLRLHGVIGFLFFIAAPTLVYISKPFILLISAALFFYAPDLPDWFWWLTLGGLFGGIILHIAIGIIVAVVLRWWSMLPFTLLFPFYWVLHSIASFKAIWDFFRRPHHWEKTEHGQSEAFE